MNIYELINNIAHKHNQECEQKAHEILQKMEREFHPYRGRGLKQKVQEIEAKWREALSQELDLIIEQRGFFNLVISIIQQGTDPATSSQINLAELVLPTIENLSLYNARQIHIENKIALLEKELILISTAASLP